MAAFHELNILDEHLLKREPSDQQDAGRITTAVKSRHKKSNFWNVNSKSLFEAIGSCSSAVSAARVLWISCCMFHPERSFSVIWHLFNISSHAVSRQRGLYTAQHLERQIETGPDSCGPQGNTTLTRGSAQGVKWRSRYDQLWANKDTCDWSVNPVWRKTCREF